MKRFILIMIVLAIAQIAVSQVQKLAGNNPIIADPIILFQEDFEDTLFELRGWYDHLSRTITTAEHIQGSTACFECKFLQEESGCEGGTPGRHLFDETDEVYISYHVKYSSNYTGSNKPYHPHEFHFITIENGIYVGPAWTHLTTYIEQNEGEPLLAIQDGENIDESNIGVDLTGITEERAVAGCNGDSDGSPVEQVMWIDNMTVATSRVTTHGIDDPSNSTSDAMSVLSQNYPNPFSQSTVIGYQLAVSGEVILKVYDIIGKEVRTLLNEKQPGLNNPACK
jgi:hypothetical protein